MAKQKPKKPKQKKLGFNGLEKKIEQAGYSEQSAQKIAGKVYQEQRKKKESNKKRK